MCIVSNISDHYNQQPKWIPVPMPDTTPAAPALPPFQWPKAAPAGLPWTKETLDALKEILKAVKALDAKLGLADCEDPKKAEWMKSIEERVKALESK